MCANPSLTLEFIKSTERKLWNWDVLLHSESVVTNKDSFNYVLEQSSKPLMYLGKSKYIDIDTIKRYDIMDWNWYDISSNPKFSLKDIFNHSNLPWKWSSVSSNPNVTLDDIIVFKGFDWCWKAFTCNPRTSMEDIFNNPIFPWFYPVVPLNPNITLDVFNKYMTKFSNWNTNSLMKCNTPNFVIRNMEYPWSTQNLLITDFENTDCSVEEYIELFTVLKYIKFT